MNDRYPCPTCERPVYFHTQQCPGCEADLHAVALLSESADVCFNRALSAANSGNFAEAARQAGASLSFRMTDAPTWVLLGKVFAQVAAWKHAAACFQLAYADRRAAALLKACLAAVEGNGDADGPVASPPGPRASEHPLTDMEKLLSDLGAADEY